MVQGSLGERQMPELLDANLGSICYLVQISLGRCEETKKSKRGDEKKKASKDRNA
jgi:hypothetical protein